MSGSRTMYFVNGSYVIAEDGVWLPGSYESKEAADAAYDMPDRALAQLQERKNAEAGGCGGVISLADLRAFAAPVP